MNTQNPTDYAAAAAAILNDLKAAADGQDIRGAFGPGAEAGELMLKGIASGDLMVVEANTLPRHLADAWEDLALEDWREQSVSVMSDAIYQLKEIFTPKKLRGAATEQHPAYIQVAMMRERKVRKALLMDRAS